MQSELMPLAAELDPTPLSPPGPAPKRRREEPKRRRRSTEGNAPYFCCRTCRTRRIKCDGARPLCKKCTAHGHVCGGYSTWGISLDVDATSTTQQPATPQVESTVVVQSNAAPSIFSTPTLPLLNATVMSDDARHAFDYFRYRMCARYAARGYPITWATSSISVGLQEPAVFYAIVALSTAEQSLVHTIHTTLARPREERTKKFALEMYSKAIASLRDPMRRAMQADGPLEVIILSCILFLVFEVTMGNNLNALRHGRIGKSILEERLRRDAASKDTLSTSSSATPSEQGTETTGTPQSSLDSTSPVTPQTPTLDPSTTFASLEEARSYLEILMDAGHSVREELIMKAQERTQDIPVPTDTEGRFCVAHTISRTMPIDHSLQIRLNEIINAFAGWGRRFAFMFTSGGFISPALFYLQIRFFHTGFTLAMCRASNEMLTDVFADQFVRTLDSVERLLRQQPLLYQWGLEESQKGPVAIDFMRKLNIADRRGFADQDGDEGSLPQMGPLCHSEPGEDRAAGVFEFGILPALFTIACKARTSSVRRRAAQLLSSAKRAEAIISSRTLSMYADAVVYLEEEQAALLSDGHGGTAEFYADEVPEHARFLDVVAYPIPERPGCVGLSCTRHVRPDGQDVELLTLECTRAREDYRLVRSEMISLDEMDAV